MALQYTTTHRSNAMSDLVSALGSTSYLLIYTGSPPSNVATADGGTLLASLPCSSPFGTVSSGVLTANSITSATAAATGTAGHWRLCTSSAGTTCIVQGLCGTSGSDLNLSSTSISTGQTVSVSSFQITAFGA
jgi:hypothetical protein